MTAFMEDAKYNHSLKQYRQSCVLAEQSSVAAVSALATLVNAIDASSEKERNNKEKIKDARKNLRTVIVKRVYGWQLGFKETGEGRQRTDLAPVFADLLAPTCLRGGNTRSQLLHGIRRVEQEDSEDSS